MNYNHSNKYVRNSKFLYLTRRGDLATLYKFSKKIYMKSDKTKITPILNFLKAKLKILGAGKVSGHRCSLPGVPPWQNYWYGRKFFLKLCGRGTGVAKAWRGRGGELLVWQLPSLPYLLPMVYGGTPELYQNLLTAKARTGSSRKPDFWESRYWNSVLTYWAQY